MRGSVPSLKLDGGRRGVATEGRGVERRASGVWTRIAEPRKLIELSGLWFDMELDGRESGYTCTLGTGIGIIERLGGRGG